MFSVTVSLLACFDFEEEDCISLLVSFATTVKYQVALVDGTVVAETLEEGVEFYVKDGIIAELYSYFISLNRGDNFIFHLSFCDKLFYWLKVTFFRDCRK